MNAKIGELHWEACSACRYYSDDNGCVFSDETIIDALKIINIEDIICGLFGSKEEVKYDDL